MTTMINIEDALAQSGVSPEAFERQLTEFIETHCPDPSSDAYRARDFLRQKVTVKVYTEAIKKAKT